MAVLTLGLLWVAQPSPGQQTDSPAEPRFVADARTLARIEDAVGREPLLAVPVDGRRFYVEVVARPLTWQEYMAGSHGLFAITPITPPSDRPGGSALGGGAGLDLLGIFRGVGRAMRERDAREIRKRIDRELLALEPAPDTSP